MKYLLITLCFYGVFGTVFSQIVYKPRVQTIRNDSPATVDWIAYSTFDQTVNINKIVEFINIHDGQLSNSTITCDLIKINATKKELLKKFICATGDGQPTSLIADQIKLSIGDRLYFFLTLNSIDDKEEFVFNIFDKKKIIVAEKVEQVKEEIPLLPFSPYSQPERIWRSKQKIISPQRKKLNRTIYNILTIFG